MLPSLAVEPENQQANGIAESEPKPVPAIFSAATSRFDNEQQKCQSLILPQLPPSCPGSSSSHGFAFVSFSLQSQPHPQEPTTPSFYSVYRSSSPLLLTIPWSQLLTHSPASSKTITTVQSFTLPHTATSPRIHTLRSRSSATASMMSMRNPGARASSPCHASKKDEREV